MSTMPPAASCWNIRRKVRRIELSGILYSWAVSGPYGERQLSSYRPQIGVNMDNVIAGIDHVIVGVRDLAQARLAWSRLGFTLSPRGRHIGQGTANYCIMFPSDYIELLGIVDPRDFVQRLDSFLARREGLMAAAFAPAGLAEDVQSALLGLQLHPSEPRALGRQLELPEGTVVPRFTLLSLPPDETPGLDSFICA